MVKTGQGVLVVINLTSEPLFQGTMKVHPLPI